MNHSATPRKPGAPETTWDLDPIDAPALLRGLEMFARHETQITERFYEIFFERRPDTVELFGAHSIAEREEMIRETLHSLHALYEGQDWLEDNLVALGKSHWEYGVTEDMYPSFVDSLIDCGQEILGDELDDAAVVSLRAAISNIAQRMSVAGESASRRRSPTRQSIENSPTDG
jgi:hemoglobin-like flavoprotein